MTVVEKEANSSKLKELGVELVKSKALRLYIESEGMYL